MNKPTLITGKDLTAEQRTQLTFRGMTNQEWIDNHSFYFNQDGSKCEREGYIYPVCHSLSHLIY